VGAGKAWADALCGATPMEGRRVVVVAQDPSVDR
jgi:hypothetical protein